MTNEERLAVLRTLRKPNILDAFRTRDEFVDWQAQVGPLLNFNEFYHANFVASADIAAHPSLSSYTINPNLDRLDLLMKQAITELEHDLTVAATSTDAVDTQELDFAEICRRLRWKQWLGLAGSTAGVFLLGFFAGVSVSFRTYTISFGTRLFKNRGEESEAGAVQDIQYFKRWLTFAKTR